MDDNKKAAAKALADMLHKLMGGNKKHESHRKDERGRRGRRGPKKTIDPKVAEQKEKEDPEDRNDLLVSILTLRYCNNLLTRK